MVNQSTALFLQACGAAVPLRLGVEHTTGREALHREFEQPFLLVGREAEADLPLDDPAVSRRHAYLQVIAGRLFCFDLRSRTGILWGGQPRRCGWLEPDRAVGIGPFAVRLLGSAGAAGAADDGDPLAALPPDQDPLPPVSLEIASGNRESASWRMDRVLALVGQTAQGTLRVGGRSVLRPSCGLLRTPQGLWVIDLLAPEGLSVNGARVRWARLEAGDKLRVGGLSLSVRCHAMPAPPHGSRATRPDALAPGVPPPGEAERVERECLRAERQAAVAEAEELRVRLSVVERSLAEVSAARDELVNAGQEAGARWEVERQALQEQGEREQRARAEQQEEAERLRQEAAVLRQDNEWLSAELARTTAGSAEAAEQLLGLRAELEGRQGQEAALRRDLEAVRAEVAEARRQGQEQRDGAHRQFDEERRQRQQEAERIRKDNERLSAELARTAAGSAEAAEQHRCLRAELEGRQGQEAALRRDLEAVRAEAAEARRQGQEQRDGAHRQFDEERRQRQQEAERLHREVATLRQDNKRLDTALAQASAEAEELRVRLSVVERSLAEVSAAHDELANAGQEAGARWEVERRTLQEQGEREQRARAEQQERFDAACHQGQEEAERLRQEAAVLRQDNERLSAELARTAAGSAEAAEQLLGLRAELEGRQGQEAALRRELEAVRAEAADARRQGQEQRDAAHRQFDEERRQRQQEAARLQQEVAILRQKCAGLIRQVSTVSYDAAPTVPQAPAAPAHRDEMAAVDAYFIALGKLATGSAGARRAGDGGRPPAGP